MINCFFNSRKISALLDGELPERRYRRLMKHISGCEKCGHFLRSMQSADSSLEEYFTSIRKASPDPVAGFTEFQDTGVKKPVKPDSVDMSFIMVLKAMLRIPEESQITASVSEDGSAAVSAYGRLVPAILLMLAILLFYAPKLEAFYMSI